MKKLFYALLLSASTFPVWGQKIEGKIIDDATEEGLPYATVAVMGSMYGTTTNQQGEFSLHLDSQKTPTLICSFLGYHSDTVAIVDNQGFLTIRLTPNTLTLEAVIVRPLPPEMYIKRVVKNFDNTLSDQTFSSHAYYRELLTEDQHFLSFTECYFKSIYPPYGDTTRTQHQLLLFRKDKDTKRIEFMRKKIDKEKKQEQKKAEKKGETFVDPEETIVQATFGGPNALLHIELSRNLPPFLDSTSFDDYQYDFGDNIEYQGVTLTVITYEAKKYIEHNRSHGKIYIDLTHDCIYQIDYYSQMRIPPLVQPLLFLYGLKIEDIYRKIVMRYQKYEERMFPEYFYADHEARLEKRHLFEENENSHLRMELQMRVNDISTTGFDEIEKEKRFVPFKKTEEQVYPEPNINWESVNVF